MSRAHLGNVGNGGYAIRAAFYAVVVAALSTIAPISISDLQAEEAIELGETGITVSLPPNRWGEHANTFPNEDPEETGRLQHQWVDARKEASVIITILDATGSWPKKFASLDEAMRDSVFKGILDWYDGAHGSAVRKSSEAELEVDGHPATLSKKRLIINGNFRNVAFIWFEPANDTWVWVFVYNTGKYAGISDELKAIMQGIRLGSDSYPVVEGE